MFVRIDLAVSVSASPEHLRYVVDVIFWWCFIVIHFYLVLSENGKTKATTNVNFSEEDKAQLVDLIKKYRSKVHNKETDYLKREIKRKRNIGPS